MLVDVFFLDSVNNNNKQFVQNACAVSMIMALLLSHIMNAGMHST